MTDDRPSLNARSLLENELGALSASQGNYADAIKHFRQAAAAGNGAAMHNLGVYYHEGLGVERNLATAAQWFLKGAELGDADAT